MSPPNVNGSKVMENTKVKNKTLLKNPEIGSKSNSTSRKSETSQHSQKPNWMIDKHIGDMTANVNVKHTSVKMDLKREMLL